MSNIAQERMDHYVNLKEPAFYQEEIATSDSPALNLQFQQLSEQVAEFVALQESALMQLKKRENEREQKFDSYCSELNTKMHEFQYMVNDFKSVMSHAGVARWRIAAEEALAQGQNHLCLIQEQANRFESLIDNGAEKIESMTAQAEDRISRVVRSFRIEYFRHLLEQSSQQVQQVSQSAISRVSATVKWIHWEKLTLAVTVALIVAVVMGLFVNDEWPWETHTKAVNERQAGKMLIEAWPVMSKSQKIQIQDIIQHRHQHSRIT